jgi:hypothetical protein
MEDVAISHPVPDLASLRPLSLDEGVQQCFVHEERVTQGLLRFDGIYFDLVKKSDEKEMLLDIDKVKFRKVITLLV